MQKLVYKAFAWPNGANFNGVYYIFGRRLQVADGLAAGDSGPERFTIVTQPAGQCKSAAAPAGKKCGAARGLALGKEG